ncbi:hypothetical protein [Candidatus Viadribacter manganicus]|uniref:Uncharacterized protein n=1 Tax=Candidatus Viadribacter manganicus TaxID=1759059 RepID=A0A1B1ALJ8_9PROT|nr:hypothetical protein [Candidatus Viadribacter manganicus]ANP47427.1 hypothetical protein ATE48_16670 [Candidatus Viadribacter manganicus]
MRIVLASLAFITMAGTVAAQEQPTVTPDALDRVYACRNISDEAQRLACYDAAVGNLRAAQDSGNLVAVDRQHAQQVDREAFGFSLPSLSRLFGSNDNTASNNPNNPQFERVDNIQMTVASVTHRRNMPSTFRMTNGQVWVQIDDEVARNVREGGTVTIERASLGSYLMRVDAGGPALRVRRQQ